MGELVTLTSVVVANLALIATTIILTEWLKRLTLRVKRLEDAKK